MHPLLYQTGPRLFFGVELSYESTKAGCSFRAWKLRFKWSVFRGSTASDGSTMDVKRYIDLECICTYR